MYISKNASLIMASDVVSILSSEEEEEMPNRPHSASENSDDGPSSVTRVMEKAPCAVKAASSPVVEGRMTCISEEAPCAVEAASSPLVQELVTGVSEEAPYAPELVNSPVVQDLVTGVSEEAPHAVKEKDAPVVSGASRRTGPAHDTVPHYLCAKRRNSRAQ
eukprot:GEMP01095805.1.p1 GENE.GEMP01095805.1~~GEMP01095805.1.p1  ORF type:complete len:162 (+),score=33.93 GEMP01095805.1:169-654(+)